MRTKAVALLLFCLSALLVYGKIPVAFASPDIYLKDDPASGITVNPGKRMDFAVPTQTTPASLITTGDTEYYWYSEPYVGVIPGPRGHSFHLYYTAATQAVVNVTVYIGVEADGSGTPALISSKSCSLEATSTVTHIVIPDVIIIPETRLNGEKIKLGLSSKGPITIYYDSIVTPCVLNYIPPPSPGFSVSAKPSSISVARGASGSTAINLTSLYGFSAAVTWSYTWPGSIPSGVTISLPAPVTPPPNGSVTSTLQVSAGTAATIGTFTLRVRGLSGTISNTTDISIQITEATTPSPTPRAGCLIVTAAYQSEMASEVVYLRHVRDNMISSSEVGKMLVNAWNAFYYSWSPLIAGSVSESELLQAAFRTLLLPLFSIIHLTAFIYNAAIPFNSTVASVIAFLFAAISSVAVYVATPLLTLRLIYRKFSKPWHSRVRGKSPM
jgi:hypothetical protein